MSKHANDFKKRLIQKTRLTDSVVTAAWPEWWSESADESASSQAELRFSIARKLGLDPRSLLEDETPRFIWDDSAKYKNFSSDDEKDKSAISSFGISIGRILINGCNQVPDVSKADLTAKKIRNAILKSQEFVRLIDLLSFLWGIGIPVIHLRLHPLSAKRMCAMSVCINDQYAILLSKDSKYPATIAFHLAHEIGHILLNHLAGNTALVDMNDPVAKKNASDSEEVQADKFALELLTGSESPPIKVEGKSKSAIRLAREVNKAGKTNGIEPGTLALCYGYVTENWDVANKAMKYIYKSPQEAWEEINRIAYGQINWENISDENSGFLKAVLGGLS